RGRSDQRPHGEDRGEQVQEEKELEHPPNLATPQVRRWKVHSPSGRRRRSKWVSWARRWWWPHSGRPLSRSVCPPRLQERRWWWISHQAKGRWHPATAQVSWIKDSARRWLREWRRRDRPRSNGSEVPSRTAGTRPASQASRRAWPAEIATPVSRPATPRPVSSASRSILTSTSHGLPVWPRLGRCSSSSQKAAPLV